MDSKVRDVADDCFTALIEKQVEKIQSLKRKDFKINPFTVQMLSQIGFGSSEPESMARALVYPRVFGTSLATSFGTRMQRFCIDAGFAKASGVEGMDIEFTDQVGGQYVYAQIKAGSETINKPDVVPMCEDFAKARRLLKTNGYKYLQEENFMLGVLYGKHKDISANYKNIEKAGWPVVVGNDFWLSLTGDEKFYKDLIVVAQDVAERYDASKHIEELIERIAKEL